MLEADGPKAVIAKARDRASDDAPPPPLRRLVRETWLVASAASIGDGRGGSGGGSCPAGRADRRRQDAGRFPTQPDRSGRARTAPRLRAGQRRAHALSVAAEGADHRCGAQSDDANPRDRAEHPRREPHRRHQTIEETASAREPAGHPADHTGTVGPVLCLGRRAGLFRRSEMRRAGRGPRDLERQARGPAVLGTGAVATVRAGHAKGGLERDGGRSGDDCGVA